MKRIFSASFLLFLSSLVTWPAFAASLDLSTPESAKAYSGWFVSAEYADQFLDLKRQIKVNNGSGFPASSNQDTLLIRSDDQNVGGASAGYYWKNDNNWFSMYALSLRYEHLFPEDIGGKLIQYSLPQFTNYTAHWKMSSNVGLATAKINILNFSRIIHYLDALPYLTVGAGVAFNRMSGYTETPFPQVTPRINPAFSGHTETQFAYNLGVGIDILSDSQFVLSLGYEYQNLGKVVSGKGAGAWTGQALKLSPYKSNNAVLKLNYFFE